MNIKEYNGVIPNKLCDEIIENIDKNIENNEEYNLFVIPKHSDKWSKIELYLYKQLLIHTKKLHDNIFTENKDNDFLIELNKPMKLNCFNLIKYNSIVNKEIVNYNKKLSRFNVMTFVYFLNDIPNFNGIEVLYNNEKKNIIPHKGTLIFLQENLDYKTIYNIPNKKYYIITGQITLKNII